MADEHAMVANATAECFIGEIATIKLASPGGGSLELSVGIKAGQRDS